MLLISHLKIRAILDILGICIVLWSIQSSLYALFISTPCEISQFIISRLQRGGGAGSAEADTEWL